ncbi:testis-specific serine/threonine-protein kinase 2 [Octopus bimaculoides]|uniref:Protein kinase domain-containing protein n=1 Tax=Octopus bimaculoides TaxID=37653 RepID=A0A0L8FZU9_OCTBM|nr:testis-specific serine/threonine-protein kinase 2 [Octopus bimaculoides]|eukprot:XP_014785365.1 PREDICTED: testis-specific serine/threonine-protein kinase 2-like [Octopus bimaculoides]
MTAESKTGKASRFIEDSSIEISGYKFGPTIGHGSYSKVKLGFSENERKKVAIKILDLNKIPAEFRDRFLPREIEIVQAVKHPNIANVFEILTIEKKTFIIMEFASHGTLLEYINLRGSLSENHARKMYLPIVNAVDYLHRSLIVHRDLKCENIMLDGENNIKLTDFGFARYFRGSDIFKTFCGSAAYAPPEILQGIPYSPVLHDIWALGVILYNMICAAMPFDDSNIKKTISDQLHQRFNFRKKRNISRACKSLIKGILCPDTETRLKVQDILGSSWMNDTHKSAVSATSSRVSVSSVNPDKDTSGRKQKQMSDIKK